MPDTPTHPTATDARRETGASGAVTDLPGELLASLSLTQKIAMLHQHTPALPELDLKAFHTGAEAAHGVAWLGPATVFPQPVGMAATWDTELIERLGNATGREVRAKQAEGAAVDLNVWAPVVNPLRHPLWGRNEEGFSEDPHLTAHLAGAYCRGLKGDDPAVWLTVPTLKHFLGYNNEVDRNVTSSDLSPRVLQEYELPAYRTQVEDGVVGAVMLSYNLVNGRPAHVSDLVAMHLRRWRHGEDLAIVSDAGAPGSLFRAEKYFPDGPTAYAAALRAGVDSFTDDGEDSAPSVAFLTEAMERGLIEEADVDRAVLRLLTLRARTGELTPDLDPYTSIHPEEIGAPAHVALAREAAAKSVVVLRNDSAAALLPLGAAPGTLAVIGSLGSRVLSDWYSGTLQHEVSIADGLGRRYQDGTSDVLVEEGTDVIALRCVRTGGYLSAPASGALTVHGATPDASASFVVKDWGGELTLRSAASGRFVTAPGDGYLSATAERVGGWVVQETFRADTAPDGTVALQHVGTGRWVRVETGTRSAALVPDAATADRFAVRTIASGHEAAERAARQADTALVVVGNDPHLGGRETLDRTTLDLSQSDQELVRVVREANPRTILVIVSSYPYALGDLADTPAIVWTSHGGQELGTGLANVLSGDAEPTGRLPQTWYRRDEDLADILDYDIISSRSTYLYSEAEPLFPLGHGLTYGSVHYTSARLEHVPGDAPEDPGSARLAVEVHNTGGRPSSELVQVYASAPGHAVGFPRRLLVGHRRISVPAGGRVEAVLTIPLGRLATYSVVEERMVLEPGTYTLLAGASAEDLPVSATVKVSGRGSGTRTAARWFRAQNFDACSNLALVPESLLTGTAITPSAGEHPGRAEYRRWESFTPTSDSAAVLDVVSASAAGGLGNLGVEVQVPGPAQTWHTVARAVVPEGFTGELDVPLDASTAEGATCFRVALSGGLVVSRLMIR